MADHNQVVQHSTAELTELQQILTQLRTGDGPVFTEDEIADLLALTLTGRL